MSSPAGWSTSSLSKAALSAFACLFVLVAACGGSGDDNNGIGISTQVPSRAATPETRTPIGVPPVSPTAAAPAPVVGGEPTAFQTADGAGTIRGNLFSAAGPKRKLVVIASFAPDSEAEWQPFAKELAGAGIAALTFQMPAYRSMPGGTRDPALVDKDVESAVLFMESRDYPLIYVLSDLNASVGAIKLAARHKVAGLITVSGFPFLDVVDATQDLQKVTAPKLFITGQDSRTPAYVQTFTQVSPEPKQSKVFASAGTGVKLLTSPDGAAAKQLIKDFLLK